MLLTRHLTSEGPRWAADGLLLSSQFRLSQLLELSSAFIAPFLEAVTTRSKAEGPLLAPVEDTQEVWASGVTYKRSREARTQESLTKDVYERVYEAERPELFFKCVGRRAVGPDHAIRVRKDSHWNAPEPELTVVLNRALEVVGFCAGNDMSSRSIEGENPLYLPQAKIYDGSCALGPGIELCTAARLRDVPITLAIARNGATAFEGSTSSGAMKRQIEELAAFLGKELSFPNGVLLMTGTGIVPPESFSLQAGDHVRISVAGLVLSNPVVA